MLFMPLLQLELAVAAAAAAATTTFSLYSTSLFPRDQSLKVRLGLLKVA